MGTVSEALTPFSIALKAEIDARRGGGKRKTPTQEAIAERIGRTQPYVSARINGEYPWSTNDIDAMAPLFNETGFSLVAAARVRAESADELRTRRNVRRARQDLDTAPLTSTEFAASTDNTPVDPQRGEG